MKTNRRHIKPFVLISLVSLLAGNLFLLLLTRKSSAQYCVPITGVSCTWSGDLQFWGDWGFNVDRFLATCEDGVLINFRQDPSG